MNPTRIPTVSGWKGWIVLAAYIAICGLAVLGALFLMGMPA